jgi:hypothetical protein
MKYLSGLSLKSCLILTLSVFLLSGCSPNVYQPQTMNAPLLSKKGELQAGLSTGTQGIELDAAYAPERHFGLMLALANGAGVNGNSVTGENDVIEKDKLTGVYGSLSGGYFKTIDDRIIFEAYAGFGGGHKTGNYLVDYDLGGFFGSGQYGYNFDVWYSHFFLQTDAGIKGKHFAFSFGARYSYLNFNRYYFADPDADNPLVLSHSPAQFIELAVTPSLLIHRFRISLQWGQSVLLSHNMTTIFKAIDLTDAYVPFFCGIGVSMRFSAGGKKPKPQSSSLGL